VPLSPPRASGPAGDAALAIEMIAAPGDLAGTVHPHPTLSELLAETAGAAA
jgi:dihydrolipoamide dehydrogenase